MHSKVQNSPIILRKNGLGSCTLRQTVPRHRDFAISWLDKTEYLRLFSAGEHTYSTLQTADLSWVPYLPNLKHSDREASKTGNVTTYYEP